MHTCRSVLCYEVNVLKKSGNNTNFDIPMGSFHGAEICDLIGLYILNEITPVIGPNCIGLYRDVGLGELKETITDFLDVYLYLALNNYHPY